MRPLLHRQMPDPDTCNISDGIDWISCLETVVRFPYFRHQLYILCRRKQSLLAVAQSIAAIRHVASDQGDIFMKLHYFGAAGLSLLLAIAAGTARAAPICTLLTDVATGKVLNQTGTCDRPNSPASTFKLPLSLMGFDSGLLIDAKTPSLPYKPAYNVQRAEWKVATDPTYWLANSVVWYSQDLTRRMGMGKFAQYIQAFQYGNQDLGGDRGKKNGLTNAWLSSSLKISPADQAAFLRKMLTGQLPVSAHAVDLTEQIMPVTDLPNGWRLHGKTGTGNPEQPDGHLDASRQFGWFIGWADKADRRVIFVHLIEGKRQSIGAGLRAKGEVIDMMPGILDKL